MEQALSVRNPKLGGNLNTGFLKSVAIFFMIIDHTAVVFFPKILELRLLGRIAFPIFIWCGVVGSEYTSNHPRYLLRLFIFTAISQPFFMLGLSHRWYQLNVFATLFLGQLALYGIKQKRYYSQVWVPILCIAAACLVSMDYGWKGVALIILMYMARQTQSGLAALIIAFCFFWGEGTSLMNTICGIPVSSLSSLTPYGASLYKAIFRLENFAVLSLPLIVFPVGWRSRLPKWFSYAAYPAHLLILWLLKTYVIR